jgi:potassium efflux system protein
MILIFPRVLHALALLFITLIATPLAAQTAGPPSSLREGPVTKDRLLKSIEEAKSEATLDDAAKEAVTKRYEEAIAHLEATAGFAAQRDSLKSDVDQGPKETSSIRKELENRRAGRPPEGVAQSEDLPADAGPEIIDARLTSERTRISELTRQVRDAESELTALEARPSANRERIVAATRELSEAEGGFAKWNSSPPKSPRDRADFAFDQTLVRMLRAELAMLEQESLSFDNRRDLLQARRDLASSDLGYARERASRLESRSGELVNARIGETERLITELGLQAVSNDPGIKALVKETRDLAQTNQALLGRISAADAEKNQSEDELERLRRESENIRAQIEIGGLEDSFSEIVLDLRRTLPTPQTLRNEMSERRKAISTARLDAFRADRELDTLPSPEGQVEELLDLFRTKGVSEEDLAKLRGGLTEFVANRIKLRQDSIDANRRLATLLGETDLVVSEILAESAALRDYLGERLIWAASAPPLGKNAFTGMRTAFLALVGPEAISDYGRAVVRIHPGKWLLAVLLAAVLLLPRRRLRRLLAESATQTRRVSTDRISNTLRALAISLWLALPVPILLLFFGWVFTSDPQSTSTTFALGKGLMAPSALLLVLRFSAVLCWTGGVAEAHFRWKRRVLDPLHRGLMGLIFLYLPAHLLLAIWWYNGGDLAAFQGPGRLVFIIAMLSVSVILRAFFKSNTGILAQMEKPTSRFLKLRRLWTTFFILLPVALAILAVMGHFLTAVAMAYLMQKTGFVVFAATLIYALLTRWAALHGRRMALADALAQREARRAAAEAAGTESPIDEIDPTLREEVIFPPEEDEPIDWTQVGEQSRHLIRAVVTLAALFGCWLAWSDALPALKYLDTRTLFAGISASDLIWLVIISVITGIIFQNLPGLLELGFLRALELESGVRNAVITLCQYFVIAIGAAVAFQTIGLDWSRFGWIAAALSVGLGFGLQEVVANFVSGLILLFERPIRVGDIVTVGGVDGVVTKIRIRATTITNWDKKEFIVPNKEFVTGTIMNWTLSSPVTRLVFPVGIAYGSDIHLARGILLDIATSQPEVLKDPAPAAVFEQFADSSLNFTLRCFLASTEQRLEMTHRINSLIYERFKSAGIEIPFPQRVVHLRGNAAAEESQKKT